MCWHHPCSYRWCKLLTFLDVLNSRVSFLVLRPHWSLPPWWLLYLWHLWSPHADVIHTGPFSYPVVSPAPPSIKFWWLTGAACESLPFPSFGSHRRLHIQIRLKGYPKLKFIRCHTFFLHFCLLARSCICPCINHTRQVCLQPRQLLCFHFI